LSQDSLGRPLDPASAAAWSRFETVASPLGTATSPRLVVASAVLHSPEAVLKRVRGFYHRFLDRGPDPPGFVTWVNALLHGMRQEQAIAGFASSMEYQARVQRLLNSPPPQPPSANPLVALPGRDQDILLGDTLLLNAAARGVDGPVDFRWQV